jgi:hypothetical protein
MNQTEWNLCIAVIIVQHVGPLLANDHEVSKYTTAVAE